MKKTVFCFVAILLCAALTGCSGAEYADTVSCEDVGENALYSLGDSDGYERLGEAHRTFYFGDNEHYDDCYLVYSVDTNDINELGVFHAQSEDEAKRIEQKCNDYVEDMRQSSRAFIASYAPEELPKLDAARVRRLGNYVVYAIMSPEDVTMAFDSAEQLLKN